ncbi:MAG: hypothetical protein A3I10_02670 [Deltaproteobacteria bacterium RIFCSPLOWO2_02_FULL_57_26]|nr:MAG: hypothetical protein A3I10_02670 [Deltaproteobacteria bacterium RIFCSPLOWO2_02_FULL_57_26]
MREQKKSKATSRLTQLVRAADAAVLGQLVERLAGTRPDVRRECLEFLQKHVVLASEADTESAALFALWEELESDLAELDEYGGGDHGTEDHVGELLYELSTKLKRSRIARDDRRSLLEEVLPYIRSGNAGMDDALYEVAYAASRDDEDLRYFAQLLEEIGKDWPLDHARRIYRKIGDREKYLALRSRRMEYGADYYDLATFYWKQGDREQALAIAREGMRRGKGRMDELRAFMAERAKKSGDREGYLELQFEQATEELTLASYRSFRKLCRAEEWRVFEARMLAATARASPEERLKICMEREDYGQAVRVLSTMGYPDSRYDGDDSLTIAAQLEERYPDQVLAFYMSGLGNLNQNAQRETYAQKARVAQKVRHMWLDVLKRPDKWQAWAKRIKMLNSKRPAFQEEFAKVVPDWNTL